MTNLGLESIITKKKYELLMNVNEINLILPNIQGKNTFEIIALRYTGQ